MLFAAAVLGEQNVTFLFYNQGNNLVELMF